jgi:hypothetical protein
MVALFLFIAHPEEKRGILSCYCLMQEVEREVAMSIKWEVVMTSIEREAAMSIEREVVKSVKKEAVTSIERGKKERVERSCEVSEYVNL